MTGAEQVWNYRFPGMDMPIATLGRRLSEIAETNRWKVETWDEDGLGEAAGLLLKLSSGRTILLRELRHSIEHFRQRGPTVYIDWGELAKFGVEQLLEEVLTSIGLSRQDLDWVAPPENQRIAAEHVRLTGSGLPPPPILGPADSYFHAVWIDASDDEPVEYYDELDANRWSIRCVRKYRNGRLEAHSYGSDNWRDVMPERPIPPTAEINRDLQFSAREISKIEFETMWSRADPAA